MLWGNRMSSCLHTEENVSSFALQSSQHSVAHIRASDDKNTFKCCWTEGIVLHILEFLWFSMNAPLWAMLEEVLQAPTGSGDADGFCSQSESKEGGGKGRQRKKGTLFVSAYVGCCSLQQTLSFCVKCHVGMRCCLDTIWIFQLPVCLFPVNKVLCFIKFVPVIFHLN